MYLASIVAVALVVMALAPAAVSGQQMQEQSFDRFVVETSQQGPDMEQLMQEAEQLGLFAELNYTEGQPSMVEGMFVNFTIDQQQGMISNYSVQSGDQMATLFMDMTIQGFQPEELTTNGPIFYANGTDAMLAVHNNPTGAMHLKNAGQQNVSSMFNLSEGVQIEVMSQQAPYVVRLTGENVNGLLYISEGSAQVMQQDGGGGIIEDIQNLFGMGGEQQASGLNVSLAPDADMALWTVPSYGQQLSQEQQTQLLDQVAQAFANQSMAAGVWAIAREGSIAYSVAPYMPVQLEIQAMQDGGMMMNVSQLNMSGIIALATDNQSLGLMDGQLSVMMGQENLQEAQSFDELVSSAAQGDVMQGMYFMNTTGEVTQLYILLPQSQQAQSLTISSGGGQQMMGNQTQGNQTQMS